MKALSFLNGSALYLEIRQGSLRALYGEEIFELPLERQESGRLTESCRERLLVALPAFLKRKNWQPRLRAICAISARGVSLRQRRAAARGPGGGVVSQRAVPPIPSETPHPRLQQTAG